MATTKKASRKTAPAVAVTEIGEAKLEEIVEATLDASRGFLYTSTAIHVPLIEAGRNRNPRNRKRGIYRVQESES